MRILLKVKILCIIMFLAFATSLMTSEVLAEINHIVLKDADKVPLGLEIEILEDKERQWTIDNIINNDYSGEFIRSTVNSPAYGFSN